MSRLKEDNWSLVFASTFNLLQYVVWVEAYAQYLVSQRYVAGKEIVGTLLYLSKLDK